MAERLTARSFLLSTMASQDAHQALALDAEPVEIGDEVPAISHPGPIPRLPARHRRQPPGQSVDDDLYLWSAGV